MNLDHEFYQDQITSKTLQLSLFYRLKNFENAIAPWSGNDLITYPTLC
ncbi:hypothetical protein [Dapis sp. BLCC M229]